MYVRQTICHKSHKMELVETNSRCNGTFLTRVELLAMMRLNLNLCCVTSHTAQRGGSDLALLVSLWHGTFRPRGLINGGALLWVRVPMYKFQHEKLRHIAKQ